MTRLPRLLLVTLTGVLVLAVVIVGTTVRSEPETKAQEQQGLIGASPEMVAQLALDFTREHVQIKSGEPQAILSRAVTPQELDSFGLSIGTFEPGCVRPQHLVIVKGDFDVREALGLTLHSSVEVPATYIAYIYDLKRGTLRSIGSDRDGAHFKKALGDPTLPDPTGPLSAPINGDHPVSPYAPAASAPLSKYVPCEDTVVPGWETPPTSNRSQR